MDRSKPTAEKQQHTEYPRPVLATRRQSIDSQEHIAILQPRSITVDLHPWGFHIRIRHVRLERRSTGIITSITIDVIADRVLGYNKKQR